MWWSRKKKKAITKPTATRSEARKRAKEKLKAIKLAKKGTRMIQTVPSRKQTEQRRNDKVKF